MDTKDKDLKEMQVYYDGVLCNKTFKYQLNNKIDIELKFYKENLCHLLGLQHVYGKTKSYLGEKGYNRIYFENITIDSLKKHNESKYNFIKLRINNFDKIYDILSDGSMLKFYKFRVRPSTDIDADFVIYDENFDLLLHLFLKKENCHNGSQYSPVSYVVKTQKDKNRDQFIKGQEYKKITFFEITEQN